MKTDSQTMVKSAGRWIRPFGLLRLVLLVLAFGSLFYLWIYTEGRVMEASIYPVTLVLEVLLLSFLWRTVSWRLAVFSFFLGFGPVFTLTILSQIVLLKSPINRWVLDFLSWLARAGLDLRLTDLHPQLWAPLTEEIWKVVPLLLLFLWWRAGLRNQAGPLDLAVLGAATGAGMQFAEHIFVIGGHGAVNPVFGLGLGPLYILVVNPTTPSNWWIGSFVPTYEYVMGFFIASVFYNDHTGTIWAGHGAQPLAFGLALGLAVLAARRWKSRLVYLLPAFIFVWSIWEHIMFNWYGPYTPGLLGSLSRLDLLGRIFPVVVVLGWILATLVSRNILRQHRDPGTAFSWRELKYEAYKSKGLFGPVAFLKDFLNLMRFRRKTAYGLFYFKASSEKDQKPQSLALLASRTQAYLLAQRLRGRAEPELTAAGRAVLDRVTPVA